MVFTVTGTLAQPFASEQRNKKILQISLRLVIYMGKKSDCPALPQTEAPGMKLATSPHIPVQVKEPMMAAAWIKL